MKPTKLLFAALATVALASSCSTSEDIPAPEPKMIDTYLSITATTGDVKTKAGEDENARGREAFIKKLTALVFYEDGTFATSKDTVVQTWSAGGTAAESINKITNIKVKVAAMAEGEASITALKVILIANADVAGITNFASLSTATFGDISTLIADDIYKGAVSETATYLPMSSDVINISANKVIASRDNWIGDDGSVSETAGNKVITMYRYVARVELESLKTDFTSNNVDCRFRLDAVGLANVSSKSLYVKEEGDDLYKTGTSFFRGLPETLDRADYYISDGAYKSDALSVADGETIVYNGTPSKFATVPMFYAFEYSGTKERIANTPAGGYGEINTMMILAGTFVDAEGNTDKIYTGTRYFRIPIKVSSAADASYGVARNTVYKVNATLTGEGTTNPDKNMLNAMVNFNITVKEWNKVTQTEDDVN